ncbi:hypothetical protein P9112_012977 [Eukaryota sp. TZLM1-RC]
MLRLSHILATTVILCFINGTYGTACSDCQNIVDTVIPSVIQRPIFAEFFYNLACDRIVGISDDQRDECKAWVEDNKGSLMELHNKGESARLLCTAIDLCGDKAPEKNFGELLIPKIASTIMELPESTVDQQLLKFCKKKHASIDMDKDDCVAWFNDVKKRIVAEDDIEGILHQIMSI